MYNLRDPNRFQKIAAGVQSWLVSIALLVGGGWTLYIFSAQLQVENARAQLAKLNQDLEQSPRLELDVSIQPLKTPGTPAHKYFECRLSVKNVGTRATILTLDDKASRIYRVTLTNTGQAVWALTQATDIPLENGGRVRGVSARVNASNYATWPVEVTEPGLYVIQVAAKTTASEKAEAVSAGAPPNVRVIWSAERYFVVD